MAVKTENTNQLEEHRRKLLVQNLTITTTERSLREYFSDFDLQKCVVMTKEGKNKTSRIYCAGMKTS